MIKEKDKELVTKHITSEFDFEEIKVGCLFSPVGSDPDPNNPDHWKKFLYSKKYHCYINMNFFPRITIEPCHTTTYNMGVIHYTKGMKPADVIWYIHNILDH